MVDAGRRLAVSSPLVKREPLGDTAPGDRGEAMLRYRARRAAARGLPPERFPLLPVPASALPLTPLPVKRRRRYQQHLRGLLRALAAGVEPPAPAHTVPPAAPVAEPVERVLQAGCRACKGKCCETGGAHAYQTVDDLRRVLAARPEAGEGEIVALYLSHLPDRTVRGSCVFHGRRGCGLPRDLRSEMCNRWLCQPLLAYRDRATGGETAAFVLSDDDGLLRGGRLVGG